MPEYGIVRCLRPYLFNGFKRCSRPQQRRFFASERGQAVKGKEKENTHDYERRVSQLSAVGAESTWYPRLPPGFAGHRTPVHRFKQENDHLLPNKTETDKTVAVTGKVQSLRAAGGKLVFLDIQSDGHCVQVVCSFDKLVQAGNRIELTAFKQFVKTARKGDALLVTGNPHRTQAGELSVQATILPTLLSPSLHQVPEKLEDPEARARHRHVDMLVNEQAITTLLARHQVEATLQTFFNSRGFTKVNTPILNSIAGGASARPFETEASEFSGEKLSLRIAPELWLKRLIVGGLEKVYEIGPAFRNEGVDPTHNPEFSICEFYEAYATLEDLMQSTETLFRTLAEVFQQLRDKETFNATLHAIPEPSVRLRQPFAVLEFLPKLEELLGTKLPNLEDSNAGSEISDIFVKHRLELPANPTLPRLLDALSSTLLEPLSLSGPTFIVHHPACMSPLSKHFVCPATGQTVAARAELFIAGREYANMYEEENSPFEQRRKFEAQRRLRDVDAEAMPLDESYLQALEWALPPTGGWGCGVDRLVMLFAGRERMADVLAFGTLRNVVGLGKVAR